MPFIWRSGDVALIHDLRGLTRNSVRPYSVNDEADPLPESYDDFDEEWEIPPDSSAGGVLVGPALVRRAGRTDGRTAGRTAGRADRLVFSLSRSRISGPHA